MAHAKQETGWEPHAALRFAVKSPTIAPATAKPTSSAATTAPACAHQSPIVKMDKLSHFQACICHAPSRDNRAHYARGYTKGREGSVLFCSVCACFCVHERQRGRGERKRGGERERRTGWEEALIKRRCLESGLTSIRSAWEAEIDGAGKEGRLTEGRLMEGGLGRLMEGAETAAPAAAAAPAKAAPAAAANTPPCLVIHCKHLEMPSLCLSQAWTVLESGRTGQTSE